MFTPRLLVVSALLALASAANVARQIQTTTITVLPSESFSDGPAATEQPGTIIDNGTTYSVLIVTADPADPSGSVEPSSSVLVNPSGSGVIPSATSPPGSESTPPPTGRPSNVPSGSPRPSGSAPSQSSSQSGNAATAAKGQIGVHPGLAVVGMGILGGFLLV